MQKRLETYLDFLAKQNGSDLHLRSGSQVRVRVNGDLLVIQDEALTHEAMQQISDAVLLPAQRERLKNLEEIDTSYVLPDGRRFRVNFFHHTHGLGAVFRAIPDRVPTFEELHLPAAIKDFAELESGLLLMTGVTSSGKSTTSAAILDRINQRKRKHIISIEDPIEYLLTEHRSLITQRAVGNDTRSFAGALRAALREDIDVIFIGELRDLETTEIALHAARTGHLVLSTLHTLDAKESIARIIGIFPKEEQAYIRMTLASVLEGVVSQRLIKSRTKGRVPAVEIMKRTSRIAEMIADERDSEIFGAIESGKSAHGMQTFDQSLLELYQRREIEREEALRNATSASDLKLMMEGVRGGNTLPHTGSR